MILAVLSCCISALAAALISWLVMPDDTVDLYSWCYDGLQELLYQIDVWRRRRKADARSLSRMSTNSVLSKQSSLNYEAILRNLPAADAEHEAFELYNVIQEIEDF